MKSTAKLHIAALAFAMLVVGASAGRWSWFSNHHNKQPKTVVAAVLKDRDTFILAAAAAKAGLIDDLSAEGPFTVFAPNNRAFVEAAGELGTNIFALLFNPDLPEILKYHVVVGKYDAASLSDGQKLQNLAGGNLTVSIGEDGTVMIDGATVIEADKKAGNGVVHIIDSVILPSKESTLPATVVDIAQANSDSFSTLLAALSAFDTEAIKATLSDPKQGPFTVFAPNDSAFAAAGVTTVDFPELPDILLYHVVPGGKVFSSDLEDGQKLMTLLGDELTVSVTDAGVFINNAQVVQADLEAGNGVVHVINAVLEPPEDVAGDSQI